jgi:NADH-quinone oxidoreductase subunit N
MVWSAVREWAGGDAMTSQQLLLLLPLIIVNAASVVIMLLIAAKRNHALTCLVTSTGLLFALGSLMVLAPLALQAVTPLLIVDSFSIFLPRLFCWPRLSSPC